MSITYTVDQLQRKAAQDPGSSNYARLANTLRVEGRLDEAISICQEGLSLRPYQLSGLLVLGKTLYDARRYEDAQEQFEKALKTDSRCLSSLYFLGQIMTQLEKRDASAIFYGSILELEPWDDEIRKLLHQAKFGDDSLVSADSEQSDTENSQAIQGQNHDYSPVETVEETFEKPEGFSGDVLEMDLNSAADFLPEDDTVTASTKDDLEFSLDELLSNTPPDLSTAKPAAKTPQPPAAPSWRKGRVLTPVEDIILDPTPPAPIMPSAPKVETPKGDPGTTDSQSPPIMGTDVEDRLDSIFGLDSIDQTVSTASEDLTHLNKAVSEVSPEATLFMEPGERNLVMSPNAASNSPIETSAKETHLFEKIDNEDLVSGNDIEQRLDDIFSLESEGVSGISSQKNTEPRDPIFEPSTSTQEVIPESAPLDFANEASETIIMERTLDYGLNDSSTLTEELDKPKPLDKPSLDLPDNENIMSTVSMLPVEWTSDSPNEISAKNDERVTGSDIEDQLDKLFDLGSNPDQFDENKIIKPDSSAEITFADLEPINNGFNDPGTTTQPIVDFDATMEFPASQSNQAEERFSVLAEEEAVQLTDTTSIEIVDGNDVESRLNEIFTPDGDGSETTGMLKPVDDSTITGSDVADRVAEIFEGMPSQSSSNSEKDISSSLSNSDSQSVTQNSDEDLPEDEEMPLEHGVGTNVATVTLAEIYFQQGLKEQALQIYRQLLEREPENESVKKRISEIETSQVEGEKEDPNSDSRRLRPGLKVPKRKK